MIFNKEAREKFNSCVEGTLNHALIKALQSGIRLSANKCYSKLSKEELIEKLIESEINILNLESFIDLIYLDKEKEDK